MITDIFYFTDNDESEIKLHETIKCSNEASSANFDQTEATKEPLIYENKIKIPNDDYEDGIDSDNDESEIKLQEIYVLCSFFSGYWCYLIWCCVWNATHVIGL